MGLFIGIDSGVHGAIVEIMFPSGRLFQFPLTMSTGPRRKDTRPRTRQEILHHLQYLIEFPVGDIAVCIEDPGVSGIFGAAKKSACQLYGSFTELRMACEAAFGFSPREVQPKEWIRHFEIPARKKGETKDHWKSRLADLARKKFPGVTVQADTADAMLIALYCKETCNTEE